MKFKLIRSFVAVYEEGSFTAAARRIHATQSGLSMRIKELEETLSVRLFDRTATGVTPTPQADRLYPRATRVLREVSGIDSDLHDMRDQLVGEVHAGLMPTITRAALAPALERFSAEHPLVKIKITEAYSAALKNDVANGSVDFAIVPPGHSVTGLAVRHLADDIELFMTRPDTSRAHLSPIDLARLEPIKLVLPGPSNARREKIDAYLSTHGVNVEQIMELDAMMATLDLVARSDWCTILPGCLGYPDMAAAGRKLHPLSPPLTGTYVLIEPSSRTMSPAAAKFAEAIGDHVSRICAECRDRFG